MKTDLPPHQKKLRRLGNVLAVISCLGLISSVLIVPLLVFITSPSFSGRPIEALDVSELIAGEDLSAFADDSDEALRARLRSRIKMEELGLPEHITEEMYLTAVIYKMRTAAGEELPPPDALTEWLLDPELLWLPEGITADTTVRELLNKDHAFFEEHTGAFRLLSFMAAAFYAVVCIIFLRMALSWRRADPFGRTTILGLRALGCIFLVQWVAARFADTLIPHAEHGELFFYTMIYQESVQSLVGGGANLSCGILFLALSWVLELGQRMKEEQALTI